jgi:hypothetical protein
MFGKNADRMSDPDYVTLITLSPPLQKDRLTVAHGTPHIPLS